MLRLIPSGLARLHRALPMGESENGITVALVDPLDLRAAEDLRFALGKDIQVVVAPTDADRGADQALLRQRTSSMEKSSSNSAKPASC